MRTDRLQQQRFELKYRVTESTACAVRSFLCGHLVPDEYSVERPDFSYLVHSLYLDSSELQLYRSTINGDKNRFKLRLRFYDDAPESPVFFEIKRRVDRCIMKQRAAVKRSAVPHLLAGNWPQADDLFSPGNLSALGQLQEFGRLMLRMHATPRSRITYRREAWMSPVDNSARVTFDRDIHCAPEFSSALSTNVAEARRVFREEVILELKFTGRMPAWAGELIRVFGLMQGSAAKYVEGVEAMGEQRFLFVGGARSPGGPGFQRETDRQTQSGSESRSHLQAAWLN